MTDTDREPDEPPHGERDGATGDEQRAPTERDAEAHREVGVEFGELADRLDDHEYPATVEELTEAYGEYELQYAGGSETFAATLASGSDTFESAHEVRQSVLNGVGQSAIGRKAYTDRGAFASDDENVSF